MFHTRENSILKFNLDQGKDILTYNDDMDKIVSPHLKLIQTSLCFVIYYFRLGMIILGNG